MGAEALPPTPECEGLEQGRAVGEVVMHASYNDPLPEDVIETRAHWRSLQEEFGLPDLDLNFQVERVHVVNVWSRLDCEYLDDTTGELGLVRIDDHNLGVIAPLARSTDRCIREGRPLPMLIAVPLEEEGEITSVCTIR
jgi:hypothetical protein